MKMISTPSTGILSMKITSSPVVLMEKSTLLTLEQYRESLGGIVSSPYYKIEKIDVIIEVFK